MNILGMKELFGIVDKDTNEVMTHYFSNTYRKSFLIYDNKDTATRSLMALQRGSKRYNKDNDTFDNAEIKKISIEVK